MLIIFVLYDMWVDAVDECLSLVAEAYWQAEYEAVVRELRNGA